MTCAAMLQSLAVCFPNTIRTNDYWRTVYPDMVREVENKATLKVWSAPNPDIPVGPFIQEMAHYLGDPFRGTIERRVLASQEMPSHLEKVAAERALAAAGLGAHDVDLLLCASFLGDHIGVGNAVFLARELGLRAPAWNIETACAGSLAGLQMAAAMVAAGQARRVLLVTSCSYSRLAEPTDTLSWTCGDGAAALLIGPQNGDRGIIGTYAEHTAPTCHAMYYELYTDSANQPKIRMKNNDDAGRLIREISEECVVRCCQRAVEAAGVRLDDIDHFVFNTPTAWYMRFCARSLGIDPERSVDTYAQYANVGPVLLPANLHALLQTRHVKRDDLLLLYAIGSVSSVGAMVVRWDDMAVHNEVNMVTPVDRA